MVKHTHWVMINIDEHLVNELVRRCSISIDALLVLGSFQRLPDAVVNEPHLMIVVNVPSDGIEQFCQLFLSPSLHGQLVVLSQDKDKGKWQYWLSKQVLSLQVHQILNASTSEAVAIEAIYQQQISIKQKKNDIDVMALGNDSLLPCQYGNPTVMGADMLIEALPMAMAIIESESQCFIKMNALFMERFAKVLKSQVNWSQFISHFSVLEDHVTHMLLQDHSVVVDDGVEDTIFPPCITPSLWKLTLNESAYKGYTLIYCHDVTEIHWYRTKVDLLNKKKKLEEKLVKQKNMIGKMMQRSFVGEAASGIAHQINQPLATLSTAIQLAQSYLSSTDSQKESKVALKLEKASDMCQEVGDIIHSIKNAIQDTKPNYSQFCVEQLKKQLASRFLHEPVVIEWGCALQQNVVTDVKIIEQSLIILTQNSLDHAKDKRQGIVQVKVTITEENGVLKIIHGDNCGGIPQEIRDEVFQPFFTTKDYGNGIGLSLIVSFVETLKGELEYIDTNPGGAIFKISVPVPTHHLI